MSEIAGLLVRLRGSAYFIPVDRVGFVTPIREICDGMLVMPNGSLPLVVAGASGDGNAVALRVGGGFVALAVDAVDLTDFAGAARARPISEIDSILEARLPPDPI